MNSLIPSTVLNIKFTKQSQDTYKKLQTNIRKKLEKQVLLLSTNFRHPSLRAKKMGAMNRFEARIDRKYRFTFILEKETVTILTIGPHDEGLGKK